MPRKRIYNNAANYYLELIKTKMYGPIIEFNMANKQFREYAYKIFIYFNYKIKNIINKQLKVLQIECTIEDRLN